MTGFIKMHVEHYGVYFTSLSFFVVMWKSLHECGYKDGGWWGGGCIHHHINIAALPLTVEICGFVRDLRAPRLCHSKRTSTTWWQHAALHLPHLFTYINVYKLTR